MKKRVIAVLLSAVMLMTTAMLAACNSGSQPGEVGGTQSEEPGTSSGKQTGQWAFFVDGKTFELPMTLAELEAMDMNIVSDSEREKIVTTPNEKFLLVAATYKDNSKIYQIKVVTGDDVSKGAENAMVQGLVNSVCQKDLFSVKGGVALGSSFEDVTNAFGEEYTVSYQQNNEDLLKGRAMFYYGGNDDGMIFIMEDGKVNSIEVLANRSK